MAWLVRDGTVLASVEVADTTVTRGRGLIGRDGIEGAILLRPCKAVHTLGMRFDLDVGYLDREGQVVKTLRMARRRVGLPVWRAHSVVEAEAGAFARWGLRVGDTIEIRE